MIDTLTMADVARFNQFALSQPQIRNPVMLMSREAYVGLRVEADPFGIYRQRRMMAKVLPEVMVYRGDEWWHN